MKRHALDVRVQDEITSPIYGPSLVEPVMAVLRSTTADPKVGAEAVMEQDWLTTEYVHALSLVNGSINERAVKLNIEN